MLASAVMLRHISMCQSAGKVKSKVRLSPGAMPSMPAVRSAGSAVGGSVT